MAALLTRQSSTCFSSKHEGVRYANASQHQDAKLSHPIVTFASVHLCHCGIDSQSTYTSKLLPLSYTKGVHVFDRQLIRLSFHLQYCVDRKRRAMHIILFLYPLLFLQVSWYAYTNAECISSNTCVSTKQPIRSRHNDLQ